MNLEKMEELANWLEQGAPHVVFDMHHGSEPIKDVLEETAENSPLANKVRLEMNQKGLGECGTICCIAGYAAKLSDPGANPHWDQILITALKALDLPRTNQDFYGHDLFNPCLAPEDCTPQQAAVAVRQVMEGIEPWV